MDAHSANVILASDAGITATVANSSAGTLVTIDDPAKLPASVRAAGNLKVAFGGLEVPVTRSAAGAYSFTVPANGHVHQDVDGNLRVVFVLDDRDSQIVTLVTAAPLSFDEPAIATDPNPGYVAHGQPVQLRANTNADPARFRFTWSWATSAQGPWTAIPGEGKQVAWTPPASGSYFVKVDAGDRQTSRTYPAQPPTPLVVVTDAAGVITTDPAGGQVPLGTAVGLHFNAPVGLSGTAQHYAWSYATSNQGPWQGITGDAPSLTWLPASSGPLFLQVAVSDASGTVSTYTTPQAALFVSAGGAPITAGPQVLQRGETATLSLAIAPGGDGPYSWYYAKATGGAPAWTALGSGGKTMPFVPTDTGAYVFRVDVPNPSGGLRSFVDTDPALTVAESKPLVTPDKQTIQRGDRVGLTLNLAGADKAPVAWYFEKEGATATWQMMPGNGATNAFIADQAGVYDFRVDVGQADGTVKSFVTTNPVLNVIDAGPLIVSDPVNDIAAQGGSVTLSLLARGVDGNHYKFIWSASQSASGPFSTLPFTTVDNLYSMHFTYAIPATFAPGPYYVKVDAIELSGTATYSFTSGVPVFTVQK